MQQRDYLLKEIERIGLVLRAIAQQLFGGDEPLMLTNEKQYDEVKNILLHKLQFHFEYFLELPEQEALNYLEQWEGFSTENIELLANTLKKLATTKIDLKLAQKALQLYSHINRQDKTYSLEREMNIETLRHLLKDSTHQ